MYRKNPLRHFLLWLAAYLVVFIVSVNMGVNLGLSQEAAAALPLGVLAIVLLIYLSRTGIGRDIGLGVPSQTSAGRMWFYLPLLILVAIPLLEGFRIDLTATKALAICAFALFVGLIEEILFRGMLLRHLMATMRPIWAVLISALTFGAGHGFSLLVGLNALDTALQIINAIIVGLVFTLVVLATGNLHAVIVAHVLYNAVVMFSPPSGGVLHLAVGAVILLVYGYWLLRLIRSHVLDHA